MHNCQKLWILVYQRKDIVDHGKKSLPSLFRRTVCKSCLCRGLIGLLWEGPWRCLVGWAHCVGSRGNIDAGGRSVHHGFCIAIKHGTITFCDLWVFSTWICAREVVDIFQMVVWGDWGGSVWKVWTNIHFWNNRKRSPITSRFPTNLYTDSDTKQRSMYFFYTLIDNWTDWNRPAHIGFAHCRSSAQTIEVLRNLSEWQYWLKFYQMRRTGLGGIYWEHRVGALK